MQDQLFWFFSIAMLLSGLLVILSRNPVNSAMFLVVAMCFMAGLFARRVPEDALPQARGKTGST